MEWRPRNAPDMVERPISSRRPRLTQNRGRLILTLQCFRIRAFDQNRATYRTGRKPY